MPRSAVSASDTPTVGDARAPSAENRMRGIRLQRIPFLRIDVTSSTKFTKFATVQPPPLHSSAKVMDLGAPTPVCWERKRDQDQKEFERWKLRNPY